MRALIATGTGRYGDPWHPFHRTTPLIAQILGDVGFEFDIDDVDSAMARLEGFDLVVVNAGDPWRGIESATDGTLTPTKSMEGLAAALDKGIGILGIHCAVASLRDYPEWAPAIGAMWIPGSSYHPDADLAEIHGLTLPDATAVETFEVVDERYCRLQPIGRSTIVATHSAGGTTYPTAWLRTVGRSRVGADVLGHDERSYESEGHRRLLAQLALWTATSSELGRRPQ